MCKRVNVHKEGKGNGKQKIENRNSQFPVPNSQFQRANVLTCKRANGFIKYLKSLKNNL